MAIKLGQRSMVMIWMIVLWMTYLVEDSQAVRYVPKWKKQVCTAMCLIESARKKRDKAMIVKKKCDHRGHYYMCIMNHTKDSFKRNHQLLSPLVDQVLIAICIMI